jgi:hypothetical protein
VYPAVFLIHLISAAVILFASVAVMLQLPLPYNKNGRTSVLCHFILVIVKVFVV